MYVMGVVSRQTRQADPEVESEIETRQLESEVRTCVLLPMGV